MTPDKQWTPRHPEQYGEAVVGEDTRDRLAKIKERKEQSFGERVVGPRVDDRSDAEVSLAKAETGGVLDPQPDNAEVDAAIEEASGEDGYLSVKNLKVALEEGPPATFDRLLDAEIRRNPPRKKALRHFLSLEQGREGGARPEVFSLIEQTLQQRNAED